MTDLTIGHVSPENASDAARRIAYSQKQAPPAASQTKTRQVYAALSADEDVRRAVLARFRAEGGDIDRWQRTDKQIMATAITAAEDAIELRGATAKRVELRRSLRDVRRRLELEGAQ